MNWQFYAAFAATLLLSAFGLGALLLASEQRFHIIKYVGVAYLVFLGLKTIRNARKAAEPKSVQPEEGRKLSDRPFWQAALTQLANPKSALSFGALMPQFIDPKGPAGAAAHPLRGNLLRRRNAGARRLRLASLPRPPLHRSAKSRLWRERLLGACLVGVGASLALIRWAT